MLKDTMSNAGLSLFTEIATLMALALFVGAIVYIFLWRKKASWKAIEELPLQDDAPVAPDPAARGSDDAGSKR